MPPVAVADQETCDRTLMPALDFPQDRRQIVPDRLGALAGVRNFKPVLVARVKFTEWTSDGQLRQPVFLGLRSDKDPKSVVRE